MTACETLILSDGNQHFVHLDETADRQRVERVTADGRDMERVADPKAPPNHREWWAVEGDRPQTVTIEWSERTVTDKWTLKDRSAAEALGYTLPEDTASLADVGEGLEAFYEPVRRTVQYEPTVVDLTDARVVGGKPPPHDGREWIPNLPHALSHRPEYGHLFPGRMPGFRQAVYQALKEQVRGEVYYHDGKHGPIKVHIRVPFDPPVNRPKVLSNGRKSKKGTEEAFHTERFELKPPLDIYADDRACATAEWDRQVASIVDEVVNHTAKPCGHCGGSGVAS